MCGCVQRSHGPQGQDGAWTQRHELPHALPLQPLVAPRVLLVDDCPVQPLLGCALLARWQNVPELANDGLEAVRLVGSRSSTCFSWTSKCWCWMVGWPLDAFGGMR